MERTIGRNLKRLRLLRDMTQEHLAEEAEISPSYLSHIETGKRQPDADLLIKLAKALGVSPKDFFEESAIPKQFGTSRRGTGIAAESELSPDKQKALEQFFDELFALVDKYKNLLGR